MEAGTKRWPGLGGYPANPLRLESLLTVVIITKLRPLEISQLSSAKMIFGWEVDVVSGSVLHREIIPTTSIAIVAHCLILSRCGLTS